MDAWCGPWSPAHTTVRRHDAHAGDGGSARSGGSGPYGYEFKDPIMDIVRDGPPPPKADRNGPIGSHRAAQAPCRP